MDMDAEDVEAWIPFWGIVGGILTIEPQEDQEDQEDQEEVMGNWAILQEALMEQRRGISLVPLVATICAIAFMWSSCSRTSPRSRTT
jgi:hypothetical protein